MRLLLWCDRGLKLFLWRSDRFLFGDSLRSHDTFFVFSWRSQCVHCALIALALCWGRVEDTVTSQRTLHNFCASAMDHHSCCTTTLVLVLAPRSSYCVVGDLTVWLWRPNCPLIKTVSLYVCLEQKLMLKVRAVVWCSMWPTASTSDAPVLLQICLQLYCAHLRYVYFFWKL